ncbi:LCP family protein [Paenisporosarcina cavernae]|uniref:Regulatory protein MsrR n=1 Tax=Paenisporosarcina cavernae TaxID=2320858 RepID=A0A385YXX7_9BACL|nr:LCP family protein [Paenisporosarcina cavernae]AYC30787.1 LytR family transcriptional regulator [Paenisporosarcina cavernae]
MEEFESHSRMARKAKPFRKTKLFVKLFLAALVILTIVSVIQYRNGYTLTNTTKKSDIPFSGDELDVKNPSNVNVLLLGVDSRGEEKSRSDTMMLISMNKEKKTIKMVSFMRDIYADIPGYKSYKLNTAYYLGGVQLAKDTITHMFGVPIQHYALIDFSNFETIVDIAAPNGVKLDVEKDMSEKIGVSLKAGEQTLNGKELLGYARFRADNEGDFGRVRRQQQAIEALKDTVLKPLAAYRYPKLAGAVKGTVETDYSTTEEVLHLLQIATKDYDTSKLTIPVENSYQFANYSHAGSVLEIDVEQNRQALQDFLQN